VDCAGLSSIGEERKGGSWLYCIRGTRPSGEIAESQGEVQARRPYLRAESEPGCGSEQRVWFAHEPTRVLTLVSIRLRAFQMGAVSEVGITQRFGPGPSARRAEDQSLDAIPERTVVGASDAVETEEERRRKQDERRASRALKRLQLRRCQIPPVAASMSPWHSPTNEQPGTGHAMSIEQVIEDDRVRRERVGLRGMDEVLDKLRAAAGAKRT